MIQTDHRSLKELLTQVIQTLEQQFYLSKLLGYHYNILYKPRKTNTVVDALSRCFEPTVAKLNMLSTLQFLFIEELCRELSSDADYQTHCQQVIADPSLARDFTVSNGLLLHKRRIWLPSSSRFKNLLLKEYHETPIGGHAGVVKTLKRLSANFCWPHLRDDIKRFVRECVTCQQTKYVTSKPGGLLQPLPIPVHIWEDISLDFVIGLPPSNGFTVLLVVVDRFSKYVHLGALPTHFTA